STPSRCSRAKRARLPASCRGRAEPERRAAGVARGFVLRHAPGMKAALPTHAALALATLVTTGCIFVDGRDRYDERYDEGHGTRPARRVAQAVIAAGAALECDTGWGAGLFVEYEGSGRYRLSTACDTELSGYSCIFDVIVDAPGLELVDGSELDDTDWVTA